LAKQRLQSRGGDINKQAKHLVMRRLLQMKERRDIGASHVE
jgi:hypothetical protein